MDAFYQSRHLPRPPAAADPAAPPHFWPPPAPAPSGAYHPPPPPPQWNHSGDAYQYPHQPPPPYSQQQPPPLQNPPPYPPPGGGYHGQPYGPPPPLPLRYPPLPLHYPPPNQAWGNSTWAQHQGWDYPERNALYINENDWAAKAKAWAANKPGEYQQTPSQFTSIGRMDDHKFAYHDQNQQGVGPPMDAQGSFSQSSNQQLPDFRSQDNLPGMTSYSSGFSYHTDGHLIRNAGVETMASTAHMSSPQKGYGPGSSIYEQEVPYIYSSSTGNKEAGDYTEKSHFELPRPSSSEKGLHMQTTLSVEQPRYAHGGQSYKPFIDPSDLPLEFEPKSGSGNESHQNSSYGHSDPSGPAGAIVGDAIATSIHAWNSSSAPGTGFSQLPLSSTGTQFDTSYVSQSSLPLHTIPPFVGVPGSNFRSPIPPTSAPFSLATGAPVHALAFTGDGNGAFNLSERPKKAAVPNWLREEIIKNKTVLSSTISSHAAESSFHSVGSEDDDKSYRTANQSDNKSIDSTKSTEDEEDDEDNLEAARSMAINQEIKRVLTEVLLKVTDELFDEIATKVLNEDDVSVEVDESAATGNQKVSSLPPAVLTPKASAKVLVQVKKNGIDIDGASDNSRRSSPRGDILGLANYASDDDETESSGVVVDASHRQESNGRRPENILKDVDMGNASLNSHRPSHGSHVMEIERNKPDAAGKPRSSSTKSNEAKITVGNASHSSDSLQYRGKSPKEVLEIREGQNSVERGKVVDIPVQNAIPSEPKGKILESTSRTSNNGKSNTEVHEERSEMNRKMDRRDYPKDRFQDRGGRKDVDERDLDSRSSSKHGRSKDEHKETSRDKREKDRKEDERKKEQTGDEKEDRSARVMKDSLRYSSTRSPSPSKRDRKSKQKSSAGHGSASSSESCDNLKKRKLSSDRRNLSPSPTRSTKRQVSRSPHSKRSHRRHSPYSSTDKRRRSRSRSPVRHRSAHKHDK